MTAAMPPALTVEALAALRYDHAVEVSALRRRCRDADDQLDAARRRCVRLEADLVELRSMLSERSANVAAAAEEWMRDDDGAALAADNVRLRGEVRRLESRLADLGGPLAATAADLCNPGGSAEVASFTTDEAPAAAPDECKRELLPLWQRSRDEHHHAVFTRGAPDSARVVVRWHPAVGFIPSVDGRAGCYSATSSAAMRDADTMATADGYELPADDMRIDEDLAYEVSGLEFNLDAEGFEPRLSGLGGLSFQRFAAMSCLAPDARNSAMARVLRAHGAIVTEAA